MTYRPLMILGAGSDVGQTLLTAGLCRLLGQEGRRTGLHPDFPEWWAPRRSTMAG